MHSLARGKSRKRRACSRIGARHLWKLLIANVAKERALATRGLIRFDLVAILT